MTGVSRVRAILPAVGECQRLGCGWRFDGFSEETIRANATHHVTDTGHIVDVTIADVTQYAPEPES